MGKDFWFYITEEAKKQEFLEVLGTDKVNIVTPISHLGKGPDEIVREFYNLDLKLITEEQKEKLILHISKKFNQTDAFVRENLEKIGVPIESKNGYMIIENMQRWID